MTDRRTAYNSTYKKLAVQWLNETLCFVLSSVLADSLRLRNRQLLVAAKRYGAFMKRHRLTFLFFFLTCRVCFGQIDYSAVLVDQKSNEPLPFVLVMTFNNSDTITVMTDIDGRFTFTNRPVGNNRIISTALGYSLLDTSLLLTTNISSDTLRLTSPNLNGRIVRLGYNRKAALADINAGTIFLLLPGGFVGTKINPADTLFENKYNLKYISRGCTRFSNDNETEYNKTIFIYLDKKYGKAWRKEVRQDIIGLKN